VLVLRPADGAETVGAYVCAIEHSHGPSVLALTRQNVPNLKVCRVFVLMMII